MPNKVFAGNPSAVYNHNHPVFYEIFFTVSVSSTTVIFITFQKDKQMT